MVGGHQLADGAANDGRDGVSSAGQGKEKVGQGKASRNAKESCRQPVDTHAHQQHRPLAMDVPAQSQGGRSDDRPDRLRRGQQAVALHADAEHVRRNDGQHGAGGGKKGGEKVQQHGAPDDAGVVRKTHAFHDGPPSQAGLPCDGVAPVAHEQQRHDHCQKRDRIEAIDEADTEAGQEHARQCRAEDRRHVAQQGVEADGVGQVLRRHQVGHKRLLSRAAEGGGGCRGRGQHVDGQDSLVAGKGEGGQNSRKDGGRALGGQHQLTAIPHVGQQAAQQGKEHNR